MNKLFLREYRLTEWAAMYLYAAYRLGVNADEIRTFAASIVDDNDINQKMSCLDFALAHGVHLTNIGQLCPTDYLQPQALSYLTYTWEVQGVDYTQGLAHATLASLQMEMVYFLEIVAAYKSQYKHEKRPATPDDLSRALSQGATIGLDVWDGQQSTRLLVVGYESKEEYDAYRPATDMAHCAPVAAINAGLWPSITVLSRAPLEI